MSDTAKKKLSDTAKKQQKCPSCGAPTDRDAYPFCSPRCADVDLGHWFQGKYGIPVVDAADDTIVEAMLLDGDGTIQDDNGR